MSIGSKEIVLRQATADDFDFFRKLHREAFKSYVERTWGRWDEEDQFRRLRREFEPMHGQIIMLGERPIGFL